MSKGKRDIGTRQFHVEGAKQRIAIRQGICKYEAMERRCPSDKRREQRIYQTVIKGLQILLSLEDGGKLFHASLQIKLARFGRAERFYLDREEMCKAMTLICEIIPARFTTRKKTAA